MLEPFFPVYLRLKKEDPPYKEAHTYLDAKECLLPRCVGILLLNLEMAAAPILGHFDVFRVE
jgi:hypothetical protein